MAVGGALVICSSSGVISRGTMETTSFSRSPGGTSLIDRTHAGGIAERRASFLEFAKAHHSMLFPSELTGS